MVTASLLIEEESDSSDKVLRMRFEDIPCVEYQICKSSYPTHQLYC